MHLFKKNPLYSYRRADGAMSSTCRSGSLGFQTDINSHCLYSIIYRKAEGVRHTNCEYKQCLQAVNVAAFSIIKEPLGQKQPTQAIDFCFI